MFLWRYLKISEGRPRTWLFTNMGRVQARALPGDLFLHSETESMLGRSSLFVMPCGKILHMNTYIYIHTHIISVCVCVIIFC